jgi:hypothetical protein
MSRDLIFGWIHIQDSSAGALQQGLRKLWRASTLLRGLTESRFRLRLAWSQFEQLCQESATLRVGTNPTAQGNQGLKGPWITGHGLDCTLAQLPGQLTVLAHAAAKESAHCRARFKMQCLSGAPSMTPPAGRDLCAGKAPRLHVHLDQLTPKGRSRRQQQVRLKFTHTTVKAQPCRPTSHLNQL